MLTPQARKRRDKDYSIGKHVLDKINDLKLQHQAGIDLHHYKKRFQQTELKGEPPSAVKAHIFAREELQSKQKARFQLSQSVQLSEGIKARQAKSKTPVDVFSSIQSYSRPSEGLANVSVSQSGSFARTSDKQPGKEFVNEPSPARVIELRPHKKRLKTPFKKPDSDMQGHRDELKTMRKNIANAAPRVFHLHVTTTEEPHCNLDRLARSKKSNLGESNMNNLLNPLSDEITQLEKHGIENTKMVIKNVHHLQQAILEVRE